MSRWNDFFKNHAFWDEWTSLNDAIQISSIDDKSILLDVEELARLKKVIRYLDGLLKFIDAELVPTTTWASFQQQLSPCVQEVLNFNSNRNISHLNVANTHADNLLSYVKPWVVIEPSQAVDSMKSSLESYNATIAEYSKTYRTQAKTLVESIERKNKEVANLYEALTSIKNEIDVYKNELFISDGNSKGTKDRIQALVLNFEEKYTEINQFYNEMLIGSEENNSIKKKVTDASISVQEVINKAGEDAEMLSQKRNELDLYYLKIFGDESSEDVKTKAGLRGEIERRITDIDAFDVEHKKKHAAQLLEIEGLLPGATSAGLATAFRKMKESFDDPIKNFTRLFYVSLTVIVGISLFTMLYTNFISSIHYENIADFASSLGWRLSAIGAAVWLAIFASKRRSEMQRLQQEYAHKESCAKSYNGFKKQIEDLGEENNEILKSLILKTVDSIAYNPSTTLDGKHEEKTPLHELVTSGFSSVMGKLKNVDLR